VISMDILVIIILILVALDTLILVNLVRLIPKIQSQAEQLATDLMNQKIKELWERRDELKGPIMQFIQELSKDMSKGQSQGSTAIMAGNMEIPLGFLPKKYQGLAQLAMMFLGRNKGGNGGSGGTNPFG